MVAGHLRELAPERAVARPDDGAVRAHPVRLGDRGRLRERLAEGLDLGVEMGVERQLVRDDERCDEDDARTPVGGEPAGEVERVLGLGAAEERNDDAAVPEPSHSSWYGTLARMTPGSSRRSRLTYRARWLCSSLRHPRVTSSGMTRRTSVPGSAVRSRM